MSLVLSKFYNITKYKINIMFVGVSGMCKLYLTKPVLLNIGNATCVAK